MYSIIALQHLPVKRGAKLRHNPFSFAARYTTGTTPTTGASHRGGLISCGTYCRTYLDNLHIPLFELFTTQIVRLLFHKIR